MGQEQGVRREIDAFLNQLRDRYNLDARYFLKGSIWLVAPQFVGYLLGLLRSVAFARMAEPVFYGQFGFILSIVGLVSILSLPGINTALVETAARGNWGALEDAARTRLRWGGLVTIVVAGVALYYLLFLEERELAIAFMFAGLFFPFTTAYSSVQSYYNGRKRFDSISRLSIGLMLSKTTVLLLVLWLEQGLVVLIVADSAVQLILYYMLYRREKVIVKESPRDPEMIGYGRSLTWVGAISTISVQLDSAILGFSFGFVEVAIFRIASVLPTSLKGLMKMLTTLTIPKIAAQPDKKVYSKSTRRRLLLLLVFNWVVVLLAILILPFIITFLYGERYTSAILYAQLLILSLAFGWPSSFFGAVLQARKRTQALYRANLVYGLLQIGLLIVSVPFMGIGGIVLSRIAARWAIVFYQWQEVRKL